MAASNSSAVTKPGVARGRSASFARYSLLHCVSLRAYGCSGSGVGLVLPLSCCLEPAELNRAAFRFSVIILGRSLTDEVEYWLDAFSDGMPNGFVEEALQHGTRVWFAYVSSDPVEPEVQAPLSCKIACVCIDRELSRISNRSHCLHAGLLCEKCN